MAGTNLQTCNIPVAIHAEQFIRESHRTASKQEEYQTNRTRHYTVNNTCRARPPQAIYLHQPLLNPSTPRSHQISSERNQNPISPPSG
jgi:hypothetical protein